MNRNRLYRAKSITGAQRRVRDLERQVQERDALLERWNKERQLLARLAAKGPAFFNPLEAMYAEKIRDEILDRPE